MGELDFPKGMAMLFKSRRWPSSQEQILSSGTGDCSSDSTRRSQKSIHPHGGSCWQIAVPFSLPHASGPRGFRPALGTLLLFWLLSTLYALPGSAQEFQVSGVVVEVDVPAGQFLLDDEGRISAFRDHPLALQDLRVNQSITFRIVEGQNGAPWRWHQMLSFSSIPDLWETGIVSGQLRQVDLLESVFWLDEVMLYAHPAQLAALTEGSALRVTYAERDGRKWLLWFEHPGGGTGRPAGLFSQDSIPSGPGTGIRSGESVPFSRNSLTAPSTMPQDAADAAGPLGIGVWGPPEKNPDEINEAP